MVWRVIFDSLHSLQAIYNIVNQVKVGAQRTRVATKQEWVVIREQTSVKSLDNLLLLARAFLVRIFEKVLQTLVLLRRFLLAHRDLTRIF